MEQGDDMKHKQLIKEHLESGLYSFELLSDEQRYDLMSAYWKDDLIIDVVQECFDRRSYKMAQSTIACVRSAIDNMDVEFQKEKVVREILNTIDEYVTDKLKDVYIFDSHDFNEKRDGQCAM